MVLCFNMQAPKFTNQSTQKSASVFQTNKNEKGKEASEDKYICPITFSPMVHPAKDEFGHVYEKSAIEKWVSIDGKSPLTRLPYSKPLTLEVQKDLRKEIKTWAKKNGHILKISKNNNPQAILSKRDLELANSYMEQIKPQIDLSILQSIENLTSKHQLKFTIDKIFLSLIFPSHSNLILTKQEKIATSEIATINALENFSASVANYIEASLIQSLSNSLTQEKGAITQHILSSSLEYLCSKSCEEIVSQQALIIPLKKRIFLTL